MAVSTRAFAGQLRSTRPPAPRPVCTQRPHRHCVVAAAASSEVPPNVAEATAWIAAWRASQQQPSGAGAPAGNGAAPAAAPAATAPAGSKFDACAQFSDGTLVFTAERLQSVKYSDVKL